MKKPVTLFIKLPCAFVLGGIVALGLMQNDPWFKGRLERLMISSVTDIVGEPFVVSIDTIDLFRGELTFKDATLSSSHGDWFFVSPHMKMNISWLSWFRGNGFDTTVSLKNPVLFSAYAQGTFAAEKPLYDLLYAPLTVPINLIGCSADNARLSLSAAQGELAAVCSLTTLLKPQAVVTKIQCVDGQVSTPKGLFAKNLQGTLSLEVPHNEAPYSLTMKVSCLRPSRPLVAHDMPYQLYFRYKDGVGTCRWRSDDGSLNVQAERIVFGKDEASGSVTLSGHLGELASFIVDEPALLAATGQGTFTGTVHVKDDDIAYKGDAQLVDATCSGVSVSSAKLALDGTAHQVKATVSEVETNGVGLKGSLKADLVPGTVSGTLVLSRPYEGIPQYSIKKGRASIHYKDAQLTSKFKADGAFHEGSRMPLRGSFTTDFQTAQIRGKLGGNPVSVGFDLAPFSVTNLSLHDQLHQKRLDLQRPDENQEGLEGVLDAALFKKVIHALTGHHVAGDAQVALKTAQVDSQMRITLEVKDASLKIPGTYTVIKELSGLVDLNSTERCVVIRDLQVTLHKGSAWSSCATFYFGEDGSLASAHVPLQCNGLLISKQKELFGTLSGGLTVTYTKGRWRCAGLLAIENAHLRSNLLSSEVQNDLMQASVSPLLKDIDLDVRVYSRMPLKVQTSFLKTDAHLGLHITGTADRPQLAGDIELAHGSFEFPYKPLFVTHGKLVLAPDQSDGPTIDLTAKNKIRSYDIMMRVTGTVHQPQVTFEATPQLSEEGIITLLFAGSDHGSLSAVMPRVLMEQIEDVLFGSEEKLSRAQQFLKGLITPLKNVRLEKMGDDQEELKAVLEVDISDRLRAKVENNMQYLDDTKVELEYVVSDDMTVKAVREREGALGGEVEMRWKF